MSQSFLDEIFEQPDALRRCVNRFTSEHRQRLDGLRQDLEQGRFSNIVLTGMGSSLHGLHPLWLTLSKLASVPSAVWDASELIHFAADVLTDKTLLVAMSQSGESAEIKRITELRRRPGAALSVTNGGDNCLARWADVPLLTHAGDEATVSNKTYTASLAMLHLVGVQLLRQDIAGASDRIGQVASALERLLENLQEKVDQAAAPIAATHCLSFIGRGPSLASARTGSLITQESSKLPCVAYSGGEFRHGPLELARPGFSAVIFAGSGPTAVFNRRLAEEICDAGGNVILISPDVDDNGSADRMTVLPIPAAEPALLPILEIVPIQFLTIPLAKANGHEPATFERASKITAVE